MEIQKPNLVVPVGGRPTPSEGQKAQLRHACQQFESLFLLQLWRVMQRTIPRSTQTLNYAEMFDFTFAEYLSTRGTLGIAEPLYQQLSQKLPSQEETP